MIPNDKLLSISFFTIFLLFTIKELLYEPQKIQEDKEIPESNIALSNSGIPTINILYCHSCGYQKAFLEYAEILRQKYPNVYINGEYYEPQGFKVLLGTIVRIGKFFAMFLVAYGEQMFPAIALTFPRLWGWLMNNKIYSCMTLFFMCNMFENMLSSTGAFEISLNGIPLWSKIEAGRIPQPNELFQIIDSHLKFSEKDEYEIPQFPK